MSRTLAEPYSSAIDNWIVKIAPGWVRSSGAGVRIGLFQFCAPFMRPVDIWFQLPASTGIDFTVDELARAILREAKLQQCAVWPGTGRDLRLLGGAWWNGGQPQVTHAKVVA